jgi:hypothetical protein
MKNIFKLNFIDVPMYMFDVLLVDGDCIVVGESSQLRSFSREGMALAHHILNGSGENDSYWSPCKNGIWSTDDIRYQAVDSARALLLDKMHLQVVAESSAPLGCAKLVPQANWVVGGKDGKMAGLPAALYLCKPDGHIILEKPARDIGFIRCVADDFIIIENEGKLFKQGIVGFDINLDEQWRLGSNLSIRYELQPHICGDYVFWPVGYGEDDASGDFFELALLKKVNGERVWTKHIYPIPQDISVYGNVIYWVVGRPLNDDGSGDFIYRMDLLTGEELEPIAMQSYARNGSAIYRAPVVNEKYIVTGSVDAQRIVILDRLNLQSLQIIDFPPGTYKPQINKDSFWQGDSLYFTATPGTGDLHTAWQAIAILSPFDGGEVFNQCVRHAKTEERIEIPAGKKPLHEYAITLHDAMPTQELVRWAQIFVMELLATYCDVCMNQKTTMDKQFNGKVHLRIPKNGLDDDADSELQAMAKHIEKYYLYTPYRGGKNQILIEYI